MNEQKGFQEIKKKKKNQNKRITIEIWYMK